jgi:hypothetical protein
MVDWNYLPDVEEYGDDVSDNFRRIVRAPVLDSSVFENDALHVLFDWWLSRETQPPRRIDFDVIDHWALVPSLFLLRVIEPDTFEIAIQGETVKRLVGRNLTGRRISVDDVDQPLRNFARYLQTVLETRQCWRCSGNLASYEREHIRFEAMDCPLTDRSGMEITHFIGVMAQL